MPEPTVGSIVDNVVFPTDIGEGMIGGPSYSTTVVSTYAGTEQRNQNWLDSLWRGSVPIGVKNRATLSSLQSFFRGRSGRDRGFLIIDLFDSGASNQLLGTGDGSRTQFQLVKHYVTNRTETRIITRPNPNYSVTITVGGVQTTSFAVNYTTGVVTFTTPPTNGSQILASFNFYVPVRFDTDQMMADVNQLLVTWDSIPLLEVRERASQPVPNPPSPSSVTLPSTLLARAIGGPQFQTQIGRTSGGFEERGVERVVGKSYFELDQPDLKPSDGQLLIAYFRSHKGRARTFPFRDYTDCKLVNEPLIYNGGNTWQIVKRYFDGVVTVIRNIVYPVQGTLVITPGSGGTVPGYTVDYSTGLVTFTSSPVGTPQATAIFNVPCRFDTDTLEMKMDQGQSWSISSLKVLETTPVPSSLEGGVL